MLMQWHKEAEWENKKVMVHNGDVWKTLDSFDPKFAKDARIICIDWRKTASYLSIKPMHPIPIGPCLLN